MTTEAQVQATHRNAFKKGTDSKTEEGQPRTRRNALKPGRRLENAPKRSQIEINTRVRSNATYVARRGPRA